jgi:putative PEP-CTERM system histidine kinase
MVAMNVSLFTYGAAAVAYLLLAALLLAQWRVRPLGAGLLMATGATLLWAAVIAVGTLYPYPPITLMQLAELARDGGWLFFLLQLLGFQEDGQVGRWLGRRWGPLFVLGLLAALAVLALRPLAASLPLGAADAADAALALWLALSVLGLLLVEQVYRNANASERWGVKFLCLGLGSLFAYDFFMYAEALLFRQLNAQLWQARGLVNALIVPWLAIAIARNRNWRMNLYVSRHVVFHTVTLMGAGLYLLAMAVIGYFIKFLGGSWGGVLQVGFLAAAGVLLFTLLFSANLRARLRVYLSKHFFSYRYDYREEWLRFTEGLATLGADEAAEGIIRAMARIALSKSGALLHRDAGGRLAPAPTGRCTRCRRRTRAACPRGFKSSGWVIDLVEYRRSPDIYGELTLPAWLRENESLWLVVPLLFQESLEGLLFLARTDLKHTVNWEDRDLLKTAGRQAAALLAQQRASTALVEARQFDAFNRLSAYVIHDLKNILAQQSLMVANAQKHRDNPAFIDDMIGTVENSVRRMQRLMDQMRSGMRTAEPARVDLGRLLESVIESRAAQQPLPSLTVAAHGEVTADRERLATVFGHIIQNAQEATPDDGAVSVQLDVSDAGAVVTVRDTGTGMSEAFIRDRLFKPFESTKGLTGMGIGAFESREYVRQLGGDISVTSKPGEGSEFVVHIPLPTSSAPV